MSGPDRKRLYRLGLREAGRALRSRGAPLAAWWRVGTPVPSRLLFAPQDLRTADPTLAADIYAGFFVFAGRPLATGGRSPFDFAPPSRGWGEALYGFGWLRHLRAAGTALAQANARSLVDEFISTKNGDRRLARETPVLARRLISFMSQSPLILEGADRAFYQRFLRAVGRCVRDLEGDLRADPLPGRRLSAAIGLCYAGLCCEGLEGTLKRATRLLGRELDRQILADGGHASRNPRILIELLFDLLPLRQIFASRAVETPEALLHAVDRMLPMLRLFRHPDGTLSHFNGMGVTAADHLATLLSYDDMRSRPIQHAPHSGYERLEAGRSLLVADVGRPPPTDFSAEASASCLAFEFSSGRERVIVNCGLPRSGAGAAAQAARATAAHSTAAVGAVSSTRFLSARGFWFERLLSRWLLSRLGPVALEGLGRVAVERGERGEGQTLVASHDGYRRRFGLRHERRFRLSQEGRRLDGEDLFLPDPSIAAGPEAVIRFHLAPGIRASRAQGGRSVMLLLPNREAWQFEIDQGALQLEASVFYSAQEGARRTEQIVLALEPARTAGVRWRFERLERGAEAAARETEAAPVLL